MFARIEEISPDFKRGWYIVKLLKWQVPLQVVSWILRDVYIDGSEFIMNGKRIRLGKVVRIYPEVRFSHDERGLTLKPSRPHVGRGPSRRGGGALRG